MLEGVATITNDGRPIVPFRRPPHSARRRAVPSDGCQLRAFARSFSTSPLDPVVRGKAGGGSILLRRMSGIASLLSLTVLGLIGLLERENVTLLTASCAQNHAVRPRAPSPTLLRAPAASTLRCTSPKRGNRDTGRVAETYPAFSRFASGPDHSMRGAAFLSAFWADGARVWRRRQTTTDVGALRHASPPRGEQRRRDRRVRTLFPLPISSRARGSAAGSSYPRSAHDRPISGFGLSADDGSRCVPRDYALPATDVGGFFRQGLSGPRLSPALFPTYTASPLDLPSRDRATVEAASIAVKTEASAATCPLIRRRGRGRSSFPDCCSVLFLLSSAPLSQCTLSIGTSFSSHLPVSVLGRPYPFGFLWMPSSRIRARALVVCARAHPINRSFHPPFALSRLLYFVLFGFLLLPSRFAGQLSRVCASVGRRDLRMPRRQGNPRFGNSAPRHFFFFLAVNNLSPRHRCDSTVSQRMAL